MAGKHFTELALATSVGPSSTSASTSIPDSDQHHLKAWHISAIILSIGHQPSVAVLASYLRVSTELIEYLCSIPNSPISLTGNNHAFVTISLPCLLAYSRYVMSFGFSVDDLAPQIRDLVQFSLRKRKRVTSYHRDDDEEKEEEQQVVPFAKRIRNGSEEGNYYFTNDISRSPYVNQRSILAIARLLMLRLHGFVRSTAIQLDCKMKDTEYSQNATYVNMIMQSRSIKQLLDTEANLSSAHLPGRNKMTSVTSIPYCLEDAMLETESLLKISDANDTFKEAGLGFDLNIEIVEKEEEQLSDLGRQKEVTENPLTIGVSGMLPQRDIESVNYINFDDQTSFSKAARGSQEPAVYAVPLTSDKQFPAFSVKTITIHRDEDEMCDLNNMIVAEKEEQCIYTSSQKGEAEKPIDITVLDTFPERKSDSIDKINLTDKTLSSSKNLICPQDLPAVYAVPLTFDKQLSASSVKTMTTHRNEDKMCDLNNMIAEEKEEQCIHTISQKEAEKPTDITVLDKFPERKIESIDKINLTDKTLSSSKDSICSQEPPALYAVPLTFDKQFLASFVKTTHTNEDKMCDLNNMIAAEKEEQCIHSSSQREETEKPIDITVLDTFLEGKIESIDKINLTDNTLSSNKDSICPQGPAMDVLPAILDKQFPASPVKIMTTQMNEEKMCDLNNMIAAEKVEQCIHTTSQKGETEKPIDITVLDTFFERKIESIDKINLADKTLSSSKDSICPQGPAMDVLPALLDKQLPIGSIKTMHTRSSRNGVAPKVRDQGKPLGRSRVKTPQEKQVCERDQVSATRTLKSKQKNNDIQPKETEEHSGSLLPKDPPKIERLPNFESYIVEEEEGSGGYGIVYRAQRKSDGTTVAIKCPHSHAHQHQVTNELRMLERFGGKSFVIKYEDCFKSDNSDCFVLEHVEHDRPEVLKKDIDIFQLQRYGYCLFRAIASLHKQGVVHRDIKPANFLFSRKSNKGYLIDFNLATDLHQKYKTMNKSKASYRPGSNDITNPQLPSTSKKNPVVNSRYVNNYEAAKRTRQILAPSSLTKAMEKKRVHNGMTRRNQFNSQGAEGSGITSVKDVTSKMTPSTERRREPLPSQGRKELIKFMQEAMTNPDCEDISAPLRKRIVASPGKIDKDLLYLTPMPLRSTTVAVSGAGLANKGGDAKQKKEGPCAGTKGFRAPEVCFRSPHQGPKLDIWSAGVTLLYLMTGRTPFGGDPENNIKDIAKLRGSEDLWEVAKLHNRESTFPEELYDAQFLPSMDLREWCCVNTKRQDFLTEIPSSLFDLVDKCLTVNPRLRISAEDALGHEFFAPVYTSLRKQEMAKQGRSVHLGTDPTFVGQHS